MPPDVLQAKIVHSLNRFGLPALRVDVDPALNVALSGSVGSPQELSRALSVVTYQIREMSRMRSPWPGATADDEE